MTLGGREVNGAKVPRVQAVRKLTGFFAAASNSESIAVSRSPRLHGSQAHRPKDRARQDQGAPPKTQAAPCSGPGHVKKVSHQATTSGLGKQL